MTEEEWLAGTDPSLMLEFLRGRVSERKLRLFACASFQHIAHLFPDDHQQQAVEMLAQIAEGRVTAAEKAAMVRNLRHSIPPDIPIVSASHDRYCLAVMLFREFVSSSIASHAVTASACLADGAATSRRQTCLFRDIFGNPFRPVSFDPSWQTLSAVRLAQSIYDERTFDKMPELADTLERAGCHDEAMLAHCREPGEHVRGCWVVDLVLGKE